LLATALALLAGACHLFEPSAPSPAPAADDPAARSATTLSVWERAKLEGVDFRAVGNEPGWHLEIRRGRSLLLVSDYGAHRYTFPAPEPLVDAAAARTRYEAREGDHRLTVVLEALSCRDTMSGEAFETRVTVILDNRTLRGCGRALH
jgi:uncharacterized membrane protein